MNDSPYYLLVGSYTEGHHQGRGISVYDYHEGTLTLKDSATTINPSFLVASPDGKFVYAVNELHEDDEGKVSAFSFDASSGKLTYLNSQPSGGGDPCYLSLSDDGKLLFVANYSGGNFTAIPIKEDGSLAEPVQTVNHEGSGPDHTRQEAPHVHSTFMCSPRKAVYVTDLGTDKVHAYPVTRGEDNPVDTVNDTAYKAEPGSGPRHIVFNAEGTHAYLVLELTGEVSALKANEDGSLEHLATYPLTDKDFSGTKSGAEVRLSDDESILYVSNRGDANDISVFEVQEDGRLKLTGRYKTKGLTPRNFIISPDGRYVLAGHQDSNSIVVFERNKGTGSLSPTGQEYETGAPVHFIFIPKK